MTLTTVNPALLDTQAQYTGFKNRIINGAMVIDQRNAGASVTPTDGQYVLDRFQQLASAASKYSVQQNAGSVTPPVGFSNYLGCTSLSAYSISASDYFNIRQSIEGFNVADLGWGTANAATVTLSFWVRSSLTGTFGGSFRDNAGTRSYPFAYTISAANTWELKSITVAGDTSGTWATNNARSVLIQWGLGVGSNSSGTAGAWNSSGSLSATGAVSVVGTNGATFYITGVQLEKGSTATSFDYRPYGTEFMLCQRYYQQITHAGSTIIYILGPAYDASNIYNMSVYSLPVTMRSAPTFSTTGPFILGDGLGANPPASTVTFSSMSMPNSFTAQIVSSGMTTGRMYFLLSQTSSALKISAEL